MLKKKYDWRAANNGSLHHLWLQGVKCILLTISSGSIGLQKFRQAKDNYVGPVSL
jgi:hypothetical protein